MARKLLFFQDKTDSGWLDECLFRQLFDEYWEKLFVFCRHHTRDAEASKEIVQEVFMSLWERRASLEVNVNIGHYLFSAVRLRIARYYRDMARHGMTVAPEENVFHAPTNNTEETVLYHDLNRSVAGLVEKLPERCRDVYTLSRSEGLSIPDIAQKLGIAEKTVEAHLTKALRHLNTGIRALEV